MFDFRRKQMSAEPDDWVPLGRQNDPKRKPAKPAWQESDVIVRAVISTKLRELKMMLEYLID